MTPFQGVPWFQGIKNNSAALFFILVNVIHKSLIFIEYIYIRKLGTLWFTKILDRKLALHDTNVP